MGSWIRVLFLRMNNTVHRFSDDESLDALTHVYLELSLPLKVALWAAVADLRDLGLQKTDSHGRGRR
jgi:hypothetical protein